MGPTSSKLWLEGRSGFGKRPELHSELECAQERVLFGNGRRCNTPSTQRRQDLLHEFAHKDDATSGQLCSATTTAVRKERNLFWGYGYLEARKEMRNVPSTCSKLLGISLRSPFPAQGV
jgi:hypothetical protein